jgi:excisionase family DNA binding protein
VCEELALGRSTVYLLIGRGDLRTVRVGKAVRVPAEELERFIASRVSDETNVTNGGPTPARAWCS